MDLNIKTLLELNNHRLISKMYRRNGFLLHNIYFEI